MPKTRAGKEAQEAFVAGHRARHEQMQANWAKYHASVQEQEAKIESVGNQTFDLLAREPPAEIERMASFVQTSLR